MNTKIKTYASVRQMLERRKTAKAQKVLDNDPDHQKRQRVLKALEEHTKRNGQKPL